MGDDRKTPWLLARLRRQDAGPLSRKLALHARPAPSGSAMPGDAASRGGRILACTAPRAVRIALALATMAAACATAIATGAPSARAEAAASASELLVPSAGEMLQYTDGRLDMSFAEGIFGVDGGVVYCVDSENTFAAGTVVSQDILAIMTQETLTGIALRVHYATEVYDGAPLPYNARVLLAQSLVWDALGGTRTYAVASAEEGGSFPELTSAVRSDVVEGAKAFARENASRYVGHGVLWANGITQKVASFWLEPACGRIELKKASSNKALTDGNVCYSLKGAAFTVFKDAGCTVAEETMRTDEDGSAASGELPAGTHYVKETSAPPGYALDPTIHTVVVRAGETARLGGGAVEDEPLSTPGIPRLVKSCSEAEWRPSGNATLGACSLAKAQYTVDYYPAIYGTVDDARRSAEPARTWVFETGEDGSIDFSRPDVHLLSGSLFHDAAGRPVYPLGTYLLHESLAPAGYAASNAVYLVKVEQYGDGTTVGGDVTLSGDEPCLAEPERPKRGDISFTKVRESDMSRLPLVPFLLTSETTGESHVLVTDENGHVDTSSSWNLHTTRTNANDLLRSVGTTESASPDLDSGVWFGLLGDGATTHAINEAGALPYDTYTLKELPCEANKGLQLVIIEGISVKRDGVKVELGTIDDRSDQAPFVNTSAHDARTLSKSVCADAGSRLVDHVEYMNLAEGEEYEVISTLVDADTGMPVEGAASHARFVAKSANGSVDVELSAGLLGDAPSRVVFFEELRHKGDIVAEHKDAGDSEQTLLVCQPSISTVARDRADGDSTVVACSEATIVDTVAYAGLTPGEAYTVEGTLMEKRPGASEERAETFLDTSGEPVTASVEFEPTSSCGAVEVNFHVVTGVAEEPLSLVAFERLFKDGAVVASHEDATDEAQTVTVVSPDVSTYATDLHDGDKKVAWSSDAHVVDEVVLTNLVPGDKYTLFGTVMDASTGMPALFEKKAFAEAEDPAHPAAEHAYATDAQEARVHEFWGSLLDVLGISDGEDGYAIERSGPVDLDAARRLLEEYGDITSLMSIGRTDFEADAACMTTSIDYGFDADTVDGEFVIYDLLLSGDKVANVHADIGNEMQSFEVARPTISTEAADDADNDHTVLPSMDASVTDTVFYEGLLAGEQYTLSGLVMDRATGEAFCPGGEAVTGEASFVPSASSGSVKVPFRFDASSLCEGYELVVFEYLLKDGETVAEHASLADSAQTVRIGAIPEGTGYDKTGATEEGPPIAAAATAAGAAALASAMALSARRRPGKGRL